LDDLQLTSAEATDLARLEDDEKLISRLTILLTIKEAIMDSLGHYWGFDFRRIECNVEEQKISVDGQLQDGWEFRLFRALQEGSDDKGALFYETYQVTVAYWRGGGPTKLDFVEEPRMIEHVTQYFPLDNVLKVLDKLNE